MVRAHASYARAAPRHEPLGAAPNVIDCVQTSGRDTVVASQSVFRGGVGACSVAVAGDEVASKIRVPGGPGATLAVETTALAQDPPPTSRRHANGRRVADRRLVFDDV